jgi:guanylate kinase
MGKLILISAPSGGGKNAVIRALVNIFPRSGQLVTTTTRPPRVNEVEGKDYYYISKEEFRKKLDQGDFLEYNEYADNYYGTERKKLQACLKKYQIVFSQAEVNGKHGLDRQGIKHLSIFLLPESLDVLEKRIRARGGVSPEYMKMRLEIAKNEIVASKDYDFRVINREGQLSETIEEVKKIIESSLKLDKTV